jgi:hypothetical protein
MCKHRIKNQNTLFCLGIFTYTYECQDIIQIALKRLPAGRKRRKKAVRFSPTFKGYNNELLIKCPYIRLFNHEYMIYKYALYPNLNNN